MSNWDNETIEESLQQAITYMAQPLNSPHIEKIREIIYRNFELGRVQKYLQTNMTATPQKYVERVCHYYQHYHLYISDLQITHQFHVWEQLRQKIIGWKNRFYPHKQVLFDDIVQEVCRKISQAIFPYDTDFEPWAYIILRNTIYSYYEADTLNLIGYEEEIEPLLYKTDLQLKDLVQSPEEVMLEFENITELHQALNNLPEKQRQFIELYYLEEKTFPEIATLLNIKINALYKLHFDALANLRKILKN